MTYNNATRIPTDGLVLDIPLNGGPNARVGTDGSANNITWVGSDRGYTSEVGDFNGSSSYITASASDYNNSNSFSLSATVTYNNSSSVANSRWYSKTDGSLNGVLLTVVSGQVSFWLYDGAWKQATFPTTLVDGQTYQINCVYDSTANTSDIFVNNVQGTQVTGIGTVTNGTSTHYIGRYGANYFDGTIGLFKIYDKALSQDERNTLYNEGLRRLGPSNVEKLEEGYIIDNISYSGNQYNVNPYDIDPYGVQFNPDGTKMFTIGYGGDSVNEFSVSVGFDLSSTVTHLNTFSVLLQGSQPRGLYFRPDGLKFYTADNAVDRVNQYTCSTAFDTTTASYDVIFKSISPQDGTPSEVRFNPDGTIMYVLGDSNNTVYQYTLSTDWVVNTATYASKSFSVNSQDGAPRGMDISADGTKLIILGAVTDTIYQYTLSTAWDISTASYDSLSFSVTGQETTPNGLTYGDSGNKIFATGSAQGYVSEYLSPAKQFFPKYSLPSLEEGKVLEISRPQSGGVYVDQSGNGNNGTPTSVTDTAVGLNNKMVFNGTTSCVGLTGFTHALGDRTIKFTANMASNTGTVYLFDSQTGRILISPGNGVTGSNNWSIFDGTAWRNFSVSTDVGNIHRVVIKFIGTSARLYIDGVFKSSVTYTQRAIGGNVQLGCDNTGGGSFCPMDLYNFDIIGRAYSDEEILDDYYANFIAN